ncbi:MAG: diacylglycerol kinase family lipid kinase [Pyrinomonadaceae bacterium]|nr:diacylglycerol kinase family lipid kinase [Pyrinomonadaceae bacterium]
MDKKTRMMVILNAAAGTAHVAGGETVEARLAEIFADGGVDAHIALAKDTAELTSLAERAAGEQYPVVVAGGGDGTINLVASKIVGTESLLGVLPLGTLNHFAKDLRISLDLEQATQIIIDGHAVRVDVGEVNGQIFINNSSLGLYPSIVRHRERQQERLGRSKWHALFWAGLTVLRRYPFLSVRLTVDGEALTRRTPIVFIGNNEYEMNGLQIGARSCLDKRHLSLYVAHRVGRARLIQLSLAALFGWHPGEAPDFDQMCVEELWIETRRNRLLVATDGEVSVMQAPLHYRIRPGVLRVIVPRAEDERKGEN